MTTAPATPTTITVTRTNVTAAYTHWVVVTEFGIVALKHETSGPVRKRRWMWVAPDGITHRDGPHGYCYGHMTKSSALAAIRRWVNATRRDETSTWFRQAW